MLVCVHCVRTLGRWKVGAWLKKKMSPAFDFAVVLPDDCSGGVKIDWFLPTSHLKSTPFEPKRNLPSQKA